MEKKRREIPGGIYEMCMIGIFVLLVIICGAVGGCSIEEGNRTKVRDLSYEILEEAAIPEELLAQIEKKKTADFKMSYTDDEYLYIVHGYGEQETGGYSICVKELYLTSNAVIFDTELIGPRKGENASASPSYPYIVIRTEPLEKSVIFE